MQIQRNVKKIAFLFMICFMICFIPSVQAVADEDTEEEQTTKESEEDAASVKPALSKTKIIIPIYGKSKEKLTVVNPEEGAEYIFKSVNKKIATVNEKTGRLTGKRTGTAMVNLLKKGKKKNKLISTCQVKVVRATIAKKNQKVRASLNGTFQPVITYENSKANYTYKSSDKKIVKVGEEIDDTGATSLVIKALAKGKATLTVTEKYKKKKNVIGTINITVREPRLDTESISMIEGQKLKISKTITVSYQDTTKDIYYDYISSDSSALEIDGDSMIAVKAASNVIVTVYQIVDENRSALGTVTVTILEETEKIPEADSIDSTYIDLSDYNNDYEDGFDYYDDNDYYSIGADYIEDETTDSDDTYDDYEKYLEEAEHIWE